MGSNLETFIPESNFTLYKYIMPTVTGCLAHLLELRSAFCRGVVYVMDVEELLEIT